MVSRQKLEEDAKGQTMSTRSAYSFCLMHLSLRKAYCFSRSS
jgi:hypothetical protein